jgi:hypothetical protein
LNDFGVISAFKRERGSFSSASLCNEHLSRDDNS